MKKFFDFVLTSISRHGCFRTLFSVSLVVGKERPDPFLLRFLLVVVLLLFFFFSASHNLPHLGKRNYFFVWILAVLVRQ
jgi:hypothetical protein